MSPQSCRLCRLCRLCADLESRIANVQRGPNRDRLGWDGAQGPCSACVCVCRWCQFSRARKKTFAAMLLNSLPSSSQEKCSSRQCGSAWFSNSATCCGARTILPCCSRAPTLVKNSSLYLRRVAEAVRNRRSKSSRGAWPMCSVRIPTTATTPALKEPASALLPSATPIVAPHAARSARRPQAKVDGDDAG